MNISQTSKDNNDQAGNDNMQKRLGSLYSKQELPTHASISEVEAMKARINELEANLKQQEARAVQAEKEAVQNKHATRPLQYTSFPHKKIDAATPKPSSRLARFWNRLIEAHPSVTEIRERNIASLAASFLIVILLLEIVGALAQIQTQGFIHAFTGPIFIATIPTLISYGLSRTKWYRAAIFIFSLTFGSLAYLAMLRQGADANTSGLVLSFVPLSLIVASTFLSSWAVLLLTVLNIIALYLTTRTGIVFNTENFGAQAGIINTMGLVLIVLANFRKRNEQQSLQEIKTVNDELQLVNSELLANRQQLELRVQDRTHDLELASEVGQSITQRIGNLSELLSQSAELIRSKFSLYYTQIYIVDASERSLVLRAGTGAAGNELLQRGHRLTISSASLNGRAALERHAVIVDDTQQNSSFLPNPLLPLTRSELAVPLIVNNKVVGVLDMQNERPGTFSKTNLPAYQVLAGQLAIAIQNSALFNQVEGSRSVLEEQSRRLTRTGWQDFMNAIDRNESIGYVFNQDEVIPLVESQSSAFDSNLIVPIEVTGAIVGEVQLNDEADRKWTDAEMEIVRATVSRAGQHIENLRLLAQADRYRAEAEQVSRRLTREGWNTYLQTRGNLASGYSYNLNEVKPLDKTVENNRVLTQARPITVRDETIGELFVNADNTDHDYVNEIFSAVATQLSSHIENLRLLDEAEQRRMEAENLSQELGVNESRLSTALDIARLGNWEYNFEKDIFYFNDSFYSVFRTNIQNVGSYELSSAEYSQRFVHPEDAALVGEEIGLVLQSTERDFNKYLEHRAIFPDGSVGHIAVNIHVERDENGKITRWYGANQDITERKTAQEIIAARAKQLEEAQTFLDSVIENLPNMLFVKDAEDLRFVRYNKAAEELSGVKREDIIGKNDHDFFLKEEADFFTSKDREVLLSGQTLDIPEEPLATVHNNTRYLHTRKVPIFGSDGKPKYLLGVSEDITDRKRDQEILAQRANQLETVATVSSTASTVLDPDKLLQAVVDLTKERFNMYHAHVYLADESWNTLILTAGAGEVGKQMVEAGHAIEMDAEKSLVARAARGRKAIIVNDVHSEGGFLPNSMLPETRAEIAVPMISGGKVLGVFDVQSQKVDQFTEEDANIFTTLAAQVAVALQNARLYVEQSETVTQLRELDRLKSSFLANMSHELRTPLNSILGFADVMLEELDGPLTENMTNDLGLIQKNGQHLLHLINDVLDMAKIESGKMNLNVEKFILHDVIDEVTNITSSLASEKSISIIIQPDSDHDVEINADKIRLRQVMINLVNNAMKFTEKGSISIRALRENNHVLISIKDTGIGIPQDHLESVFQEFTQVDTTTTRKVGGTGLGLPISRRLIQMHSGRLWAESTGVDGEGATFYVQLPIEANINESPAIAVK
jgi:PAS domain S-box-containing protein